jgi:hypothetical protein
VGLSDVKALITVKADTSQAKAEMRSLRGEERKRHQALLDEMGAQNRKIDEQIAFWGKMAIGVGATVAAFKLAQVAAKSYLEDVRLESAAAGANLGGLQRATRGLVEADTLLAFAGKSMNGVWKLNQAEMETVLNGAMALRKTMGVELQPTVEALTEAIAKGNTRSLKEFGIEAKDKQGVLKALGGAWAKTGGDVALAGDEFVAANVAVTDSFDDIKGKLGEMVLSLAPAIDALGVFVGLVGDGINSLQSFADSLAGGNLWDSTKLAGIQNQAEVGRLRAQASDIRAGTGRDMFGRQVDPGMSGGGLTNLFGADSREAVARDIERQADELERAAGKMFVKEVSRVYNSRAAGAAGASSKSAGRSRGRSGAGGVDPFTWDEFGAMVRDQLGDGPGFLERFGGAALSAGKSTFANAKAAGKAQYQPRNRESRA